MELNSLKNVELLRKGLYSEQLHHYAGLCKVYRDILVFESKNPNYVSKEDAEKVFSKYAALLNAASKGDYSFIENHNLSRKYEEFFKSFAYHSLKLEQFKKADELLKDSIDVDARTQKPTLSTTNLNKFKSFMREPLVCETEERYHPTLTDNPEINTRAIRSNTTQNLLYLTLGTRNLKYGHSPRWLGHKFFNVSKDALALIQSIDQTHLPANFSIADKLTPASFGAEITGVKGNIQKFFERFKKKDQTVETSLESDSNGIDDYKPFTQREQDYFKKQPGKIHENIYNQVVTAKKGSLQKAMAATLAVVTFGSILAMSLPSIAETRNFNSATKTQEIQIESIADTPMTVFELNNVTNDFASQTYTDIDSFKEDANYTLDAIQQTCKTMLNQHDLPTVESLKSILNNLDDVTSMLIEKPVEMAYQEKYPNFSNFKADLYYNDLVTDYTNLNQKNTEEGVKVTATDPDGNEITTEIPNIGSPLGSTNLFNRVLKQERNYDHKYKTLFEALSNENATNPKTGKTYTYSEIRDLCNEFLGDIIQECEVARTLTAPNVVIETDGTFKFVIPEAEAEVETEPVASTLDSAEHDDR